MDLEQEEMQFLGFFGIYKETCKLIFKCWKIFTQITITLILPLSLIFLAHEKISEILYWRIWFNEFILSDTKSGTPEYHRLSNLVSSEWAVYVLIKVIYFTFVLAFSLLSTSAVVYTVACACTSRQITLKKLINVVPRVWKRLMVTFLCAFFAFCAYNMVFGTLSYIWRATVADSTSGDVVFLIMLVLYAVGFVYLTIIWQLASVVSVLEDSYGIRALIKSKNLIKGKMVVATAMFFMLNLSLVIINIVFKVFVVYESYRIGVVRAIGLGALCSLLLSKMILFGLVVQTVIYFICKTYHKENIDKSALLDHLEVYLGDYVPLMAKDVQMEDYHF